MNNELKEMLQSVIQEAIQPLYDRFDKLEARFDELEHYTKTKFAEVDAKLTAISEQVASNTERLVEIEKQMVMKSEYIPQMAAMTTRMDELTLDVKVLKKAIAN